MQRKNVCFDMLKDTSQIFKTEHTVNEIFLILQEKEKNTKQDGNPVTKDVSLLDLDDCKY